jgi:hypothetical protein
MSHKATGWLADVSGVTPSEFRILFILCDCHNPSKGCFPSQGYLQTKSGMSNGSINNQLNSLENKGLIAREKRIDPVTKQRMSTMYILGFDLENPIPDIGEGANSNLDEKPSPKNGQSQLQLLETNSVKEPCNKPVSKVSFNSFWKLWPNKVKKPAARVSWNRLSAEDQRKILSLPRAGFDAWQKSQPNASPIHASSFLNQRRWEDEGLTSTTSANIDRAAALAETIKGGGYVAASYVSPDLAREVLGRKLATETELKERGIQW